MLPPDFYARKQAALRKSEQMRVVNGLRDAGLDPTALPYRFMTPEEEAVFLADERPPMNSDCPLAECVPNWKAVIKRIAAWVEHEPEVAIWYDAQPGSGGLILPGPVLAKNLDAVVSAVNQHGNVMLVTPNVRSGCVYFEEEYRNYFAIWGGS